MEPATIAARLVTIGSLAVAGLAQVPPHAVVLNPTLSIFATRLAHEGDAIHALSYAANGTAVYAHSRDGGRTWPRREVSLGACGNVGPIAADGDQVVAIVYLSGLGPHAIRSSNGGVTWSAPARVFTTNGPFPASLEIALTVRGSVVNVVWNDFRPSAGWLWANRSADGGASWSPGGTRIDGSAQILGQTSTGVRAFTLGSMLHVVWYENVGGNYFTMYQRSIDNGVTWNATPVVISAGRFTSVVANASMMLFGTTPPQRSVDAGGSWQPLGTGHGLSFPLYAGDGTRLLATSAKLNNDGTVTVLTNTSLDGGQSWSPTPVTALHTVPMVSPYVELTPFVRADVFYVHCRFILQLPNTLRQSIDGGATWRQLQGNDSFVSATPERILALNDMTQVRAYVALGHTTLGTGTPGTGAVVPALRGGGNPSPGCGFSLTVRDAVGGSAGVLAISAAPPTSLSLGQGTLYVQPPMVTIGFATGAGSFVLPIAVPDSPVFSQITLVSQALVIDPGSVDGFTLTQALETWLR